MDRIPLLPYKSRLKHPLTQMEKALRKMLFEFTRFYLLVQRKAV
ncbi:MAG: hypothetical protein O2951_05225 [Bacteroidetes bacterium]|nr:hypothetical protein [Bacteroidota bacterium]